MSHHSTDASTITAALELVTKHSFDELASALEIILNKAMRIERSANLRADPWERTGDRRGYANGFKSETVKTRAGEYELLIPKTRGHAERVEPFYPQALERATTSEPSTASAKGPPTGGTGRRTPRTC